MPTEHRNYLHDALNQLLAASYHATPEELTPIFNAISALHAKHAGAIAARRKELASAFVERKLAERGKRK